MTVDDGYVLQDSDYPAIPEWDGYRGEWDTYTSPITSNMTIQANYIAIWHTVKFVANGVTVKTITVDVGYVLKAADYPEIPIRVGYVSSWNQYTGPITSNITIQASYVRSDHLVRFIDDGTLVKTMTVGHGYVLKDWDYPELPEVAGYRVSWNKYSEPITADLVVWANYAVAPHTVTFVADGVTVKTMEVEDGYVLTDGDYPAVPEKEGYWGSWNVQTAPITQDTTIRAVYRLAHMHTVTFVASGKTVKTLSVPDGYTLKSSDYPEVPQKTGYDGKWKEYTAPVTADITIQAVYTPGTPVPTLPTDPGDLMSLEDEAPTTEENPEDLELAASEEVAATSSSPAMRLVSTVTEQHSYIYASGRLLRETITTTAADGTVTTEVLDFAYDAQGIPYSLTYTNGTASPVTYYYITNLQGDVMQLIDSAGETKATYSYDPYGQVLRANGAMAEINPLQYRGYYYESETGFYYLQSRYYNPVICRFINADSFVSTGQSFSGYNMFAYCNNNPVPNSDPTGDILISTLILIGSAIVGAACAGYTAYKEAEAGIDTVQIVGDSLCAGFSAFFFVYSCGMSGYQCYQNYCYLNGLTPVTEIGSSASNVEAQLQVCADKANTSVAGKGPVVGTQKHAVFAEEVNALGNSNLRTEVSYKNGCEVPYGTKGSVRFDVMMYDDVGAPAQAWDFKTGAATLTTSRIAQMQSKSGLVGLRISMIK